MPPCHSYLCVLLLTATLLPGQTGDPSKNEVPLPAKNGWHASLVLDNDVGVWTVRAVQLMRKYGCPEIIGLDDKGRCIVIVSYSGKWTPMQTVEDGAWLGALAHADLDPHRAGPELYTGGKPGNLWQIWPRPTGGFDANTIAHFPGLEIHTLVTGDLAPDANGTEMLAFSRSGEVFMIEHDDSVKPTGFRHHQIAKLEGRVRDAVVLPRKEGPGDRIIAVTRSRQVLELHLVDGKLVSHPILEESMGFGRISRRRPQPTTSEVLYVTRDDGLLLRLEEKGDGWVREVIYAGPQGPRGVAAGRFFDDASIESVATFGYAGRVQLVWRHEGQAWQSEDIFVDRDKGHWLTVAEVDGRNATDELVASGYGKRVVLLSRPPGYGLAGTATDPNPPERPTEPEPITPVEGTKKISSGGPRNALRIAIASSNSATGALTSLSYQGGFEAKTSIYETLVRRDRTGKLCAGLASEWRYEDARQRLVLTIRKDATWHDGTAVAPSDVVVHFRRWVGLPEHDWLPANRRIQSVAARGEREVVIEMDQPHALLPQLCAVNPTAIVGPTSRTSDGRFLKPIGTGLWFWKGSRDDDRILELDPLGPDRPHLDLIRVGQDFERAMHSLLGNKVDGIASGWALAPGPSHLQSLRRSKDLALQEFPGSASWYLEFRHSGSTADLNLRRHIAGVIDRTRLIHELEAGYADANFQWAAPSIAIWPKGLGIAAPTNQVSPPSKALRLIVRSNRERERKLGAKIEEQLREAGIPVDLIAADPKERASALDGNHWDLRIERSWGVPYDPFLTLVNRYLPPTSTRNAAVSRSANTPPALRDLVQRVAKTPSESSRIKLYGQIQALMDAEALVVPLYTPRRIMVRRHDAPPFSADHDLHRMDFQAPGKSKQ